MKCENCQKEIPSVSRFCLHCGASQPELSVATGQVEDSKKAAHPEIDWLAREDALFDYEAQRRFGGTLDQGISCLMIFFMSIMGLLMIVPGVSLLAIFGVPLAIILTPLTYFNIGGLQPRLQGNKFLKKLPGFTSGQPLVLALSVFFYLGGLSVFCYFLLTLSLRR